MENRRWTMKYLKVVNFGPIKSLELNLEKKIQVVIGPQASGKSTLVKIIYFCRKIKDYVLEYLSEQGNFPNDKAYSSQQLYQQFILYIRRKFMGCFGTTKHLQHFEINYYYNFETCTGINISLDTKGFARIKFSKDIQEEILKLLQDAIGIFNNLFSSYDGNVNNIFDILKREIKRIQDISEQYFKRKIMEIFYDNEDIIYIPAGRSILSTFSDQLSNLNVSAMDLPMQEFIERIMKTRNKFSGKMDELVVEYTKTVSGQINNSNVNLAIKLSNQILRGQYVCDKDAEKIYFNEKEWVKLMYASSGQQEALWLLMLMFSYILENRKAFIVLEEPEAHLYPEAQKLMISLIALFCNSSKSSVFLTTHSPYILTSINVLIESYIVENNKKCEKEASIVERPLRIAPQDTMAYMIDLYGNDFLRSIMDTETKLINSYEIDGVSENINNEMDLLIERAIKYDL